MCISITPPPFLLPYFISSLKTFSVSSTESFWMYEIFLIQDKDLLKTWRQFYCICTYLQLLH
jgi:hypothetical protein